VGLTGFKKIFLGLVLIAAVLAMGCTQQQAPAPTQAPTTLTQTQTPTIPRETPTQTETVKVSPTVEASPVRQASPTPSVNALEELKKNFELAASSVFGDSVKFVEESPISNPGFWSFSKIKPSYQYDLWIQPSPYKTWSSEETGTVRQLTTDKGGKVSVSIVESIMGKYTFEAKMPCYNWKYFAKIKVVENNAEARVGYGEKLVKTLGDYCPQ